MVQSLSNEAGAQFARMTHPLRAERWSVSDLNPWTWWLGAAAEAVKSHRQPVDEGQTFQQAEKLGAALISAAWNHYRDMRDAASEVTFFQTYGGLFGMHVADKAEHEAERAHAAAQMRETERVQDLLARITEGGYAAAVARAAYLLARRGQPILLDAIETKRDLMLEYRALMPDLPRDEARRVRGEQEIIVNHAPQQAIETLPELLARPDDRKRFVALFERLLSDPRVQAVQPTDQQQEMLERLRLELKPWASAGGTGPRRRAAGTRAAKPGAGRTATRPASRATRRSGGK